MKLMFCRKKRERKYLAWKFPTNFRKSFLVFLGAYFDRYTLLIKAHSIVHSIENNYVTLINYTNYHAPS